MIRMKQLILFSVLCLLQIQTILAQNDLPRLSPRPLSVANITECYISLDGNWTFQTPSIKETGIEVPGEWTMQGFDVPEGETAVYIRNFTLPVGWEKQRVKIRFDGVSSFGQVMVNGKIVGEHEGGMVSFELDVSTAIKPGDNELRVDVKANTISDRLGCVSQYAVHTVGGLIRKVSLYALPEINIAALDAVTTFDSSYKNATLQLSAQIANETNAGGTVIVEYILNDASGKKVASVRANPNKQNAVSTNLKVGNARLWNPEQPYLYTLVTNLLVDGKNVQTNTQRVGLRQVEVKDNTLLVNGKKIKLHGVNRHEAHPLRGRSLTPELCRKDAEIFRAGNCNYIRTSHYPPSEEFLDACDELGLFVECEAAITWIQHHASPIWKLWNYEDEKFLPYMIQANLDNIAGNRRHPSIIIWSLGNESRWSALWEQVLVKVKQADLSRPTSFHDQCWGGFNNAGSKADIANYHYPGKNGPAACDTMSRPVLFGEYAHLSCYNRPELATDPGVRAAFGKPLVEMYDSIYYHSACLGGALWSGIDDIFHLADGRILGYGPWGPVDGWRREKPEYIGMKQAYTPFRLLNYTWKYDQKKKNKIIELNVENRYDFTDFSKVIIEYGARGGKMNPLKANLQPRSKGKITISADPSTAELYLKVTDPRGFICAEELLSIGESPLDEHMASGSFELEENDEAYIVSNKNKTQNYVISKVTGLITRATIKNKTVLQQGPVFCLIPMNFDDGGKPNVAGETYQNNIYPVKNYPEYTLFAKNMQTEKKSDGGIVIQTELSFYGGSSGHITYHFGYNNEVEVSYEVTLDLEEEGRPRQYGMLMQLPASYQTLSWERKGEFTVYPEYDIARTKGTARLNANDLYEVEAWRKVPQGAWKDDANICGSVDFRSTKTQIENASLTDDSGNGIDVVGYGKQALRAWLQDGCIQLLMGDYSNSGSEPFYGSPFTSDRIKVKKGDILKGKVTFKLK